MGPCSAWDGGDTQITFGSKLWAGRIGCGGIAGTVGGLGPHLVPGTLPCLGDAGVPGAQPSFHPGRAAWPPSWAEGRKHLMSTYYPYSGPVRQELRIQEGAPRSVTCRDSRWVHWTGEHWPGPLCPPGGQSQACCLVLLLPPLPQPLGGSSEHCRHLRLPLGQVPSQGFVGLVSLVPVLQSPLWAQRGEAACPGSHTEKGQSLHANLDAP